MKRKIPTILIITKDAASRGGVANYYNLFFKKVNDDFLCFERFDIGSRSKDYDHRHQRFLGYCVDYVVDVCCLVRLLFFRRDISYLQFSPSLIPIPLIRDGLLLIIARFFGRSTVVFIRGWRDDVAEKISSVFCLRRLFISVFCRADKIIVLADDFRRKLEKIGIPGEKIIVSRTMFDGNLIQPRDTKDYSVTQFLFLSRISREKGAFEIVEAAAQLKQAGLQFKISFHGHGATVDTVSELKTHADALGVSDQIDVGDFLEGVEKYQAYSNADVFLLPSHHEGCPNSVLEAMGSGCFVICTGAGAMKEVVQDGINGHLVRIEDANDLAEKMAQTIENLPTIRQIGKSNRDYAFTEFESRIITQQIKEIYRELLK